MANEERPEVRMDVRTHKAVKYVFDDSIVQKSRDKLYEAFEELRRKVEEADKGRE